MAAPTDLYNLAPALELMGVGLLVAGLPFAWFWRRHRQASDARRLKALTWLTLALTFELILVGAFTRLTDSGLGCPDWPGCYGSASPLGASRHIEVAQAAMPDGPVTHSKAWIEMVHRYMATGVGGLIIVLTLWTIKVWRREPAQSVHPLWPAVTLLWVCLQGAFGALTVTMKLFPAIVTLHLLMAMGLLALLCLQTVRYDGWRSVDIAAGLRRLLWLALALLLVQTALGGWVSTNYAVLACRDFPTCQGQWWPQMDAQGFVLWRELGLRADGQPLPFEALTAIHFVHRHMAWLVLALLCWSGVRLRTVAALAGHGRALLLLSALQLLTGLSNVVLGWPLLAAVLHTGGASALIIVLVWALALGRSVPAGAATLGCAPAVRPNNTSEPVA
ncbi:MAG: heme A synthase [Betaproteobacteria bacterium]|nr:heme A synthase [Betaproteobacteria bacterium]